MKCPYCGYQESQVKDTRPGEDGQSIRRRRECLKCGERFTTFEYVQSRDLLVVKKNDVRVPFERDKLHRSIHLALRKRDVDNNIVNQLVSNIIRQLEKSSEGEVSSSEIGQLVMNSLLKVDKVAYIRYASVYKNFTKMEDFNQFATQLLKEK